MIFCKNTSYVAFDIYDDNANECRLPHLVDQWPTHAIDITKLSAFKHVQSV